MSARPYCVVVTFDVTPDKVADFREAMLENARLSLENEPGCRVFDVCSNGSGDRVFLYEVYDDRPAFDAHLGAPHFLSFDARVNHWVLKKTVQTYDLISERTYAAWTDSLHG